MNHSRFSKMFLTLAAACALNFAPAYAQPTNIALGKRVIFGANPNYALSTDPDDKIQLTDGQYSSVGNLREVENTTSIWVQKGTVGWQNVNPVIVTIDLGSVQPISGISYSTAAGRAGVQWPTSVFIAVSDDEKTWHALGDLVELSHKNGTPPAEGYAPFRYITRDLKTRGRYVTLAAVSTPYTFIDEIEVYAGDPQWIDDPPGGTQISDIREYVAQNLTVTGVRRRLRSDLDAIRNLAQSASISAPLRSSLINQLEAQASLIDISQSFPADFKAIIPLTPTHRNILAVHGDLLAAQGLKTLTVWKQHRYAWLPLLAHPTKNEPVELNFSMLRNQFRSDALLLTNASNTEQTVKVLLGNPPRGAQPGWLKVDAVEWTDTNNGTVVPDALVPLMPQNGVYTVTVPAGMTRKLWLTVDSSKLAAGNSQSYLEISGAGVTQKFPLKLAISQLVMKRPRISLGMWDYTDGKGLYGITPQNRDAAIALMQSHYVDTPWAAGAALPRPNASAFDAQNVLQTELDFSHLDEWIKRWPDARRYFVFASVGDSFAGAKTGSPEFAPRVGSWAKAISAHMSKLGLRPQQLGILLVDEPRNDNMDAIIAAWAKAINAAAPELTLFEDPTWERPDQTKTQEAITEIDVLCPMLPIYYKGGKPVHEYFENLRKQGKELWFYQCTGPTRLYDPQLYFRYQPWHTYAIGGTGQGFWSFGDTGKAQSSWNEYAAANTSYAPAFLDATSVHNSVHWDAVREGMQDYEELAMLQDAINTAKNTGQKQQAQRVLDEAVRSITHAWSDAAEHYTWYKKQIAPELGDMQLAKVRAILETLAVK